MQKEYSFQEIFEIINFKTQDSDAYEKMRLIVLNWAIDLCKNGTITCHKKAKFIDGCIDLQSLLRERVQVMYELQFKTDDYNVRIYNKNDYLILKISYEYYGNKPISKNNTKHKMEFYIPILDKDNSEVMKKIYSMVRKLHDHQKIM